MTLGITHDGGLMATKKIVVEKPVVDEDICHKHEQDNGGCWITLTNGKAFELSKAMRAIYTKLEVGDWVRSYQYLETWGEAYRQTFVYRRDEKDGKTYWRATFCTPRCTWHPAER